MKRLICLLLCVMMLVLCACSGGQGSNPGETTESTGAGIDPNTPLSDGKTLKILAVTSSFGLNTTDFLYDIAKAEGCTDVVVARLYTSGCTLKKHVQYAESNTAGYEYTKNDSGKWKMTYNASLLYGLQDEDWDIILLQQSAAESSQIETYQDYIDQLMAYINEHKTNPNARFVWNMLWAYQGDSEQPVFVEKFGRNQMDMYETTVNVVKQKIVPRTDFSAIIPTGTAIQNARTSYFGDNLTRDTLHLNNLGKAIAGYTLFSTLTGKELTEINLGEINSTDDPKMLVLSDSDREVIIEVVNTAIKTPFEITQSTHTEG